MYYVNMSNNIPQIDVRDVYKKIDAKETDFVLLDVRTPYEFKSVQRIKGSINIPVDEIESNVEEVLPDKEKTIYVYCLSGSRSPIAVMIMKHLGYKNVYDMISGIMACRVYGLPLEK
jgi:phage shock protein E